MPQAIEPRPINGTEFANYTSNWRKMIDDNDISKLRDCFISDGKLLNYVFLPAPLVTELLSADATVEIRTKFALVSPVENDPLVFTIVLYGIDRNQIPTTGYYLAGVAALVADVSSALISKVESQIPFDRAYNWIKRWNGITSATLSFDLFKVVGGRLRGYTHELLDFKAAAARTPAAGNINPALWLNFALPDYYSTDLFGTVLTLNSEPVPGTAGTLRLVENEFYYDVSKPCPPAC